MGNKNKQVLHYILLITALSFLLRLYYLNAGLFHYDDVVVASNLERMFQEGGFFQAQAGRYGYVFLTSLLYYPYALLTGNSADLLPAFTSALFGSLSILLFMLVVQRGFQNNFLTYTSGLLLSITPLHFSQSTIGKEHTMSLFFLLLGVYFLLRYQEQQHGKWLCWSSLAFGAALSVRESNLLIIPLFLLFGFWIIFRHCGGCITRAYDIQLGKPQKFFVHVASLLLPVLLLFFLLFQLYLGGIVHRALNTAGTNLYGHVFFRGLFSPTLPLAFRDLITTLTIPGWILFVLGIGLALFHKKKEPVVLFLLWLIPFVYFGNTLGYKSRYLIELLPPFILFLSLPLAYLWKRQRYLGMVAVACIAVLMFSAIYPVLTVRRETNSLKELSFFLQERTEEDAFILVNDDARFIEYYAQRQTISHPLSDRRSVYTAWIAELVNLSDEHPLYLIEVRTFGKPAFPNYDVLVYNGTIRAMINDAFTTEQVGEGMADPYHDATLRFHWMPYYVMRMHSKK